MRRSEQPTVIEITGRKSWRTPKSLFRSGVARLRVLTSGVVFFIGDYSFRAESGDEVWLPASVPSGIKNLAEHSRVLLTTV
ncbi:MAG: hypothetical protein SFX74_07845 [Fimbriimonadaceae bacterium]|nr:hypothetical protein [Fimbriimonadaceae bacterium]